MIDYAGVFSFGGVVLWEHIYVPLRECVCQLPGNRSLTLNPVAALIHTLFMDGRDAGLHDYEIGSYHMEWTVDNRHELIFIVVYSKVLQLPYVTSLVQRMKDRFMIRFSKELELPAFEQMSELPFQRDFEKLLHAAENDVLGLRPARTGPRDTESSAAADGGVLELDPRVAADGASAGSDVSLDEDSMGVSKRRSGPRQFGSSSRGGKGGSSKGGSSKGDSPSTDSNGEGRRLKKKQTWGVAENVVSKKLDFSEGGSQPSAKSQFQSDAEVHLDDWSHFGISAGSGDSEDEDDVGDEAVTASAGRWRGIGSLFNGLANRTLTKEMLAVPLAKFRDVLVDKNVASEVADAVCASVASSLEGQTLSSFTRVQSEVRRALSETMERILTPARPVDVLRDIADHRAKVRTPFVIVFIGVNGVGKSTNLAKVCSWLLQNGLTVEMAACDTFRSGAVEQLRTHANNLGVPLFAQGYEKDPAAVAQNAIAEATRKNMDVVLVDTAGRMQNNTPLLNALVHLVQVNKPNLIMFVGEALVGNEAVTQLTAFNQILLEKAGRPVDGIILSKFDTIDDKMGAAVSMVHCTGVPIAFVGTGQTYPDLRRLNTSTVIQALLK